MINVIISKLFRVYPISLVGNLASILFLLKMKPCKIMMDIQKIFHPMKFIQSYHKKLLEALLNLIQSLNSFTEMKISVFSF